MLSTDHRVKYLTDRAKVQENGCWEWSKSKDKDGYGYCCVDGFRTKAHRLSFMVFNELTVKDIKGYHICHTCDNPSCINPNHLFKGTPLENKHDMINKGRDSSGTKHGNAKLSKEDVQYIRKAYGYLKNRRKGRFVKDGVSYKSIATQYGVSPRVIELVIKEKTYIKEGVV